MTTLQDIVRATKTHRCLECGKCTSLCPISHYDPGYSPRAMIEEALLGLQDEIIFNKRLFSCLTCETCSQMCPCEIDYPEFVRQARAIATTAGEGGFCAHAGVTQSVARLQARSSLPQRRLAWVDAKRFRTSTSSDVMLFVGCAPYFGPVFKDYGSRALDVAEGALAVLNAMGIEPLLHPDEKCCGHDALWLGDGETFRRLAEHNARIIREAGVKTLVFFCPEGYRTFKIDYPQVVQLSCEVLHISELMARAVEDGRLKLGPVERAVTFHDPCRLGRHLGVYDAPRQVLAAIPGLSLVEMEHNRGDSICCGTSCFINCDATSRKVREERLLEARATGASTLVTACPKCQTHFKCAQVTRGAEPGPDLSIPVLDLVNLVAEAVERRG